jgi:hypothetical protein
MIKCLMKGLTLKQVYEDGTLGFVQIWRDQPPFGACSGITVLRKNTDTNAIDLKGRSIIQTKSKIIYNSYLSNYGQKKVHK